MYDNMMVYDILSLYLRRLNIRVDYEVNLRLVFIVFRFLYLRFKYNLKMS